MFTEMINRIKKIQPSVLFCILIGVLALCLMVYIYSLLDDEVIEDTSIVQNQPYDITIGDRHYANEDLAGMSFEKLPAGTKVVYKVLLKGHIDNPLLRVYCRHSIMDVYVGGEKLYSYGKRDWHMFGYGYLTIRLSSDYEGKELLVEQTIMESGEVGALKLPVIYNSDNYLYRLVNSKRLYLFFDIGMIVLGLSVILVSIIFMNFMPEIKKLLWMSIAFCGVGIWVFCSSYLIMIFVHNDLRLKGYLEYLSLYISPVFFLLYFIDENFREEKNRVIRFLYAAIVGAMIVFPITAIILHFTDILHLPRILTVCHILLGIVFIYTLFTNIRLIVLKRFSHPGMLIGTLVLILVCILDMINYFIHRYNIYNSNSDYSSVMLVGLFLFAICLIIDFFTTQRKSIIMEAKSQALEKIAYVDIMTGLYNRRRCDEEMEKIAEKSGKVPFGIINFDLNDLKKTNDRYGHLEGDKLISDFSDALNDVFGDKGLVGRMGGDEFIVIFDDIKKVDVNTLIDQFYKKLDEMNKSRNEIRLSGACGIAVSGEEDLKKMAEADKEQAIRIVQEIYQRADSQMYKNKAKMKESEIVKNLVINGSGV